MRQRRPTRVQKLMIVYMVVAFSSLFMWLIPEVSGILSKKPEDTYSEWVWDLPLWGMLAISFLHLVAGILFVWSAGHFIEGFNARR